MYHTHHIQYTCHTSHTYACITDTTHYRQCTHAVHLHTPMAYTTCFFGLLETPGPFILLHFSACSLQTLQVRAQPEHFMQVPPGSVLHSSYPTCCRPHPAFTVRHMVLEAIRVWVFQRNSEAKIFLEVRIFIGETCGEKGEQKKHSEFWRRGLAPAGREPWNLQQVEQEFFGSSDPASRPAVPSPLAPPAGAIGRGHTVPGAHRLSCPPEQWLTPQRGSGHLYAHGGGHSSTPRTCSGCARLRVLCCLLHAPGMW